MRLQQRIDLLQQLANYLSANGEAWQAVKLRAERENGWFTQEFIDLAINAIVTRFLNGDTLASFARKYNIPPQPDHIKTVGVVMAGNIPLVGFHDWLCVFLSGHRQLIKASSKDAALIKHISAKIIEWNSQAAEFIQFADMLKGCDAYIATGSNNSARYFDYYFKKYPSIIRRNRTSVAVLTGHESAADLDRLSDDVYYYFGLGCRNVTKLYVPAGYDFVLLLQAFKKYSRFADHNKFRNNYDYQLALLLLNGRPYMTNDTILLTENESVFSPISQLHYEFYHDKNKVLQTLEGNADIQCIAGEGHLPFGHTQQPLLEDFADGVDTMAFLGKL
jgi:hypothetical protein